MIKPDLSGNSRQRAFWKTSVHRTSANICGKRARQKLSAAKLNLLETRPSQPRTAGAPVIFTVRSGSVVR